MSVPEIINIGTTANDGSGDPIRNAFSKINNNFQYISTYIPLSGVNINISGNVISTEASNNSIFIEPNGTGILKVKSAAWINSGQSTANTRISTSGQVSMIHVDSVNNKVGINTGTLTATSNTLTVIGSTYTSGNIYGNVVGNIIGDTTVIGNLTVIDNTSIDGDVYITGGNIITDAGILHLANNKTPTQAINNVFVHFCDSGSSLPEYKLGISSVGMDYYNPANIKIVLGTDAPITTPNIYVGEAIVGNVSTFSGVFALPRGTEGPIIGSYSQSFSDPDFTIYTPGKGRTFIVSNLVMQQRTVANSVGSAGDLPGMIAVNSSNIYVCTGTYDGSTAIWKYSSLTSF